MAVKKFGNNTGFDSLTLKRDDIITLNVTLWSNGFTVCPTLRDVVDVWKF
jgi:hypothetical protein